MQSLINLQCCTYPQGVSLGHRTPALNSRPCYVYFESYHYYSLIFFVALTLPSVDFYTFSHLCFAVFVVVVVFPFGFNLDPSSLGLYTSL